MTSAELKLTGTLLHIPTHKSYSEEKSHDMNHMTVFNHELKAYLLPQRVLYVGFISFSQMVLVFGQIFAGFIQNLHAGYLGEPFDEEVNTPLYTHGANANPI